MESVIIFVYNQYTITCSPYQELYILATSINCSVLSYGKLSLDDLFPEESKYLASHFENQLLRIPGSFFCILFGGELKSHLFLNTMLIYLSHSPENIQRMAHTYRDTSRDVAVYFCCEWITTCWLCFSVSLVL